MEVNSNDLEWNWGSQLRSRKNPRSPLFLTSFDVIHFGILWSLRVVTPAKLNCIEAFLRTFLVQWKCMVQQYLFLPQRPGRDYGRLLSPALPAPGECNSRHDRHPVWDPNSTSECRWLWRRTLDINATSGSHKLYVFVQLRRCSYWYQ